MRFASLSLLFLLILLSVESGVAQEQDVTANPDSPSALAVSQELEARRQRLQLQQEEAGIYDMSLVEAYKDLADFYAENGYHDEAKDLYTQALMVLRVNLGLNSENQVPILDAMIASNMEGGDWQSVDDEWELKFHIQRQSANPASEEFIDIINGYGDWKTRMLRENLLHLNYRTLSREAEDLSDFYDRALTSIDALGLPDQPKITSLLYQKSVTDLALSRSLAETPFRFFPGTTSEYITQSVCRNVRGPNGQVTRQCYTVQQVNPRYQQSQRDAKRLAVLRSMSQVDDNIERLENILLAHPDMPAEKRSEVQSEINELQTEYQRIDRTMRRDLYL